MVKDTWKLVHADILDSPTEREPGGVFEISNTLGTGFLEKVCQRVSLLPSVPAAAEAAFPAVYKGHCMGECFAGDQPSD